MTRTWDRLDTGRWWRCLVALLGIGLMLVAVFCLVHCADDEGISPELCAKMVALVAIVGLSGLPFSGWLALGLTPGPLPVPIALLDRPPRPSHS